MVAPAPSGYRVVTANLGVKDSTPDFCLIVSDRPAAAAGVYTKSRFAGPSVERSRDVTATGAARAIAVISKNANVANGPVGDADALEFQELAAGLAGCRPEEVVIASTGVIGRPYPMERIRDGLARLGLEPQPRPADHDGFWSAAEAIMTTDTVAKLATAEVLDDEGRPCAVVCGIAKGVGMIEPDMATLLAFFLTDAAVDAEDLDRCFRRVVDRTFNALSIDTDTSTSDTAVILANGPVDGPGRVDIGRLEAALGAVALDLVLMIAADGEGASKVIEVTTGGARDPEQARRVAKSIVNSPLVKTAVHGADPNWGRIVMAVGKCADDTDINPDRVTVAIGDTRLYPIRSAPAEQEAALVQAARHLGGDHVRLVVDLGIGDATFVAYGCDLTDGYVRINADYTT
ncbi:MAG: bifunctional glutamate N-acetyltransferase/amino-acid acetyltransferase ArgJ [Microthrixaceae bacterium]